MYGMDFEREMIAEKSRTFMKEVEERRLARLVGADTPTLRARVAKSLFGVAVMVERNATWDAVWEKMEAPRHS